jgi:hypothetical protein
MHEFLLFINLYIFENHGAWHSKYFSKKYSNLTHVEEHLINKWLDSHDSSFDGVGQEDTNIGKNK